ncbi:hypothetical protein Q5752_002659 [Cryptotrichosporon argae]
MTESFLRWRLQCHCKTQVSSRPFRRRAATFPVAMPPGQQEPSSEDSLEWHSSDDPTNADVLSWDPQQIDAPPSTPPATRHAPSLPQESATFLNSQPTTSQVNEASVASATQLDSPRGFAQLAPSTAPEEQASPLFSRHNSEIVDSLESVTQPTFVATQLASKRQRSSSAELSKDSSSPEPIDPTDESYRPAKTKKPVAKRNLAVDRDIVESQFADRRVPDSAIDSVPTAFEGLFAGKVFLVTNCTDHAEQQQRVIEVIKKHDGTVQEKWEALVDSTTGRLKTRFAPFVICIGSLAQRKSMPAKVMVALATGMPIVDHHWVYDTVKFGAMWQSYLTAFASKIDPDVSLSQISDGRWGARGWRVSEALAVHRAFAGKSVAFVTPLDKAFVATKHLITICLKALDADVNILKDIPANLDPYDVVIVEDRDKKRKSTDGLRKHPKAANVFWLIECLVRGMVLPPQFM